MAADRPAALLLLLLLLLLEDGPDIWLLCQGPLEVISSSCTAWKVPLLQHAHLLPLLQLLLLLSLLLCSVLSGSTCLVLLCFKGKVCKGKLCINPLCVILEAHVMQGVALQRPSSIICCT
jgi:hypothetical protein